MKALFWEGRRKEREIPRQSSSEIYEFGVILWKKGQCDEEGGREKRERIMTGSSGDYRQKLLVIRR